MQIDKFMSFWLIKRIYQNIHYYANQKYTNNVSASSSFDLEKLNTYHVLTSLQSIMSLVVANLNIGISKFSHRSVRQFSIIWKSKGIYFERIHRTNLFELGRSPFFPLLNGDSISGQPKLECVRPTNWSDCQC